ncbi:MAG: hypothetical protein N5P05_004655 (plasmid) [Chroococcopsis gigantea SAG 12.99]|nr:hypothetical protein [Chroococcopsis gigantea SAG 12.99]
MSSHNILSTQEIGELPSHNKSVNTSSAETPVTEVTVSLTNVGKGFGVSPDDDVSPVTFAIDSQEEISTPETAPTDMTLSIPSEYQETIAEVILWLEICVGEGNNSLRK